MMRNSFFPIADLVNLMHKEVNLVGIVIETSLPKNTNGTDVFCSIKIIDESRHIYVHFFAETMDKLPSAYAVGDILVVTRVMMKKYDAEPYVQYNKKFSTFALFDGRNLVGQGCVPYVRSRKYELCQKDKLLVTDLRMWSSVNKIEGMDDMFPLKDIKEGEGKGFNLLCKILHVHQVQTDSWMLLVWNGTDAPPVPVETRLDDELDNPLPLQLESSPLARDLLCKFPAVGTILRMKIDQSSKQIGLNFIHTNRWVKFTGIKIEVYAALWNAVLMPFSKLCYLRDDDVRVLECERYYNERADSKYGRMPESSFPWPSQITGTDHPDVPFVSLMNILTHPEVIGKFRCVVRVVAMLPWEADYFRDDSGIYRIRLTLEDSTARIRAYIYKEDGIKFFGDNQSTDELTKKRNILLGIGKGEDTMRNPPWIQCCLVSYGVEESDEWGSRCFRIFDTTIATHHSQI